MKKITVIILLAVMLLSAFSIPALAGDDNATGGDGSTHPAAEGFGWYNSYQYLYKVTLLVGKRDTVSKQSSLANDFYRIGTVIVKKTGWSVSSAVMFGSGTKMDYYGGTPMTRLQNPYIISDANCPAVPICCKGGDLDIVKQYFGSTGTMTTLLNAIAAKAGTNAYGLLRNRTFTINGTTKSGWSEADLMPNGISNKVPWVIIYEPMILMHLKDKVNQVAFTATEYAIAQQNGWYDWRYSGGNGQNVAILPERHLPSSIQLEESWFGYPVYPVRSDNYRWPYEDIVKGGGWGMRWLGVAVNNGIDLSCQIIEYDPSPLVETSARHVIRWYNNKNYPQTVLCEVYSGDYLVTSRTINIAGNSYVTTTQNLIYHATRTHKMIAKINYANRNSETNPNNNTSTVTVVPRSSDKPAIDYGVYFGGVETPEPNGYGQVEVNWRNYKQDVGTVLCELYRGTTLIWSGYKTFEGNETIKDTYSVYYPGTATHTLTAKINYANRSNETDPNDNMRTRDVTPVKPTDGTYDFSVSEIAVTPGTVFEGDTVTVTFRSDNWNKDVSYSHIPVELLIEGQVVKTDYVNFTPYGSNYHSYTVRLPGTGYKAVAARINWNARYSESNSTNNYTATLAFVHGFYEFAVAGISLDRNETPKNGQGTVSFMTANYDTRNSYTNIPVQILFDGKVVYTAYVNYEAGAIKNHSVTFTVGSGAGVIGITARVNWQDHLNEVNISNNETDAVSLTVSDSADLGIVAINPNAPYREGLEVVTAFRIYNYSGGHVIPANDVSVTFRAYCSENGQTLLASSQTWERVVIPSGGDNLVWFKWKVPEGTAGKKIFISASLNSRVTVPETDWSNNIADMTETVAGRLYSATPDTQYERERPSGYRTVSAPAVTAGEAKWSVWEYQHGTFVRVNYGIGIKAASPVITADQNDPSAEQKNGRWTMKSGYGFSISYSADTQSLSGYAVPNTLAYTGIQTAYATFPEFGYSTDTGKFRTLEKANGTWQFESNPDADHRGRIHFTPLWFPDGDYTVSVTASDFWTPAGMISANVNCAPITIKGSAYDDWFLGR